jgi:glycosyltransferase involved in cell wall biosynthesis
MLNLCIDISAITYQRGVSRYTSNLVHHLAQLPNIKLNLYGYSFRKRAFLETKAFDIVNQSLFPSQHNIKIQPISPNIQSILWSFGLNKIKNKFNQIDVLHSWDWIQPPDINIPLVSTIHDLAILKYPQTAHPKVLKKHQNSWKILKKRQAEIICPSYSVKNDIISLLNINPDKIHVIHEALPIEIEHTDQKINTKKIKKIKQKLKLPNKYILFVGTREPRKNLTNLIKAWKPLAADYSLVIAGDQGWGHDNFDLDEQTQKKIVFTGRVTDQELTTLYSETTLFAYPSLDEGFGLPILEAFYHGTPVLTSNRGAMKEVAGNAAILIDPESVKSINTGIRELLNEDMNQQKLRLKKMIIRKQLFNWRKAANMTLKVYQTAINKFNK